MDTRLFVKKTTQALISTNFTLQLQENQVSPQ